MQNHYHSLGLKSELGIPPGHQIQAPFCFGILHITFHKLLKLHNVEFRLRSWCALGNTCDMCTVLDRGFHARIK